MKNFDAKMVILMAKQKQSNSSIIAVRIVFSTGEVELNDFNDWYKRFQEYMFAIRADLPQHIDYVEVSSNGRTFRKDERCVQKARAVLREYQKMKDRF